MSSAVKGWPSDQLMPGHRWNTKAAPSSWASQRSARLGSTVPQSALQRVGPWLPTMRRMSLWSFEAAQRAPEVAAVAARQLVRDDDLRPLGEPLANGRESPGTHPPSEHRCLDIGHRRGCSTGDAENDPEPCCSTHHPPPRKAGGPHARPPGPGVPVQRSIRAIHVRMDQSCTSPMTWCTLDPNEAARFVWIGALEARLSSPSTRSSAASGPGSGSTTSSASRPARSSGSPS